MDGQYGRTYPQRVLHKPLTADEVTGSWRVRLERISKGARFVSQEHGNVRSVRIVRCELGVKTDVPARDCLTASSRRAMGSKLCNQPVNPVTARLFKLGADGVRSGQHCTAHHVMSQIIADTRTCEILCRVSADNRLAILVRIKNYFSQ